MGFPLDDLKKELADLSNSASPEFREILTKTIQAAEDRADVVEAEFIQRLIAERQARNSS